VLCGSKAVETLVKYFTVHPAVIVGWVVIGCLVAWLLLLVGYYCWLVGWLLLLVWLVIIDSLCH
jgi:hypothetical protein